MRAVGRGEALTPEQNSRSGIVLILLQRPGYPAIQNGVPPQACLEFSCVVGGVSVWVDLAPVAIGRWRRDSLAKQCPEHHPLQGGSDGTCPVTTRTCPISNWWPPAGLDMRGVATG